MLLQRKISTSSPFRSLHMMASLLFENLCIVAAHSRTLVEDLVASAMKNSSKNVANIHEVRENEIR